jgi:tetratricopeptide (TPR) repeat protein
MRGFTSLWRVGRLVRSGNWPEVIAACERELSENPDNIVLRKWLALAYEAHGDNAEALRQALAVLATDQEDELALRLAGSSLAKLNRHDEAIGYVAKYLKNQGRPNSLWAKFRSELLAAEGKEARSKWIAWARDYMQWHSGHRGSETTPG